MPHFLKHGEKGMGKKELGKGSSESGKDVSDLDRWILPMVGRGPTAAKKSLEQTSKGIKKSFTKFIRDYKTGEIPYTIPSWVKSYIQGKVPLTVPKSIQNDPKSRANLMKYMKTLRPKGPSGSEKGYARGGGIRKARYK